MDQLRAQFDKIAGKDGKLTLVDFQKANPMLTAQVSGNLFKAYDMDDDGLLTFDEYVVGTLGSKLTDLFK